MMDLELMSRSDSAAKQILLHIDSSRDGPNKFILRDGAFTLLYLGSSQLMRY
jgi:hypothetical protein